MRQRITHISIASVAMATLVAATSGSTAQRLVYDFTYSSSQNTTARDSANPAEDYGNQGALAQGNGASTYKGSLTDKGTMLVEVVSVQSDGGLVVNITENGEQTRRAPAATCVVYGNTRVICDPNKTVNTEEYTLLRFLGRNFIDPSNIDAHRHWQIVQDSPAMNMTADYTLGPTTTSDVSVDEARKIRQAGGGSLTTDVQTKIGYDISRSIPTSVDEYVTQRHDNGVVGTSTTIYQTTLRLLSDTGVEP